MNLARAYDPDFWRQYYWLDEPRLDHDDAGVELPFEVSDEHELILAIGPYVSEVRLELVTREGVPETLGWDDQAHFHPHVLRWAELERIGQAIAAREDVLFHPGVPLLLLARFAPIVDERDAQTARGLTDEAWDSLVS